LSAFLARAGTATGYEGLEPIARRRLVRRIDAIGSSVTEFARQRSLDDPALSSAEFPTLVESLSQVRDTTSSAKSIGRWTRKQSAPSTAPVGSLGRRALDRMPATPSIRSRRESCPRRRTDPFPCSSRRAAATWVLPMAALLSYSEALGKVSAGIVDIVQGSSAVEPHPVTGARSDYDEMLGFTDNVVIPKGAEPCAWHDDEFDSVGSTNGVVPRDAG
jgi:hypothetical protein